MKLSFLKAESTWQEREKDFHQYMVEIADAYLRVQRESNPDWNWMWQLAHDYAEFVAQCLAKEWDKDIDLQPDSVAVILNRCVRYLPYGLEGGEAGSCYGRYTAECLEEYWREACADE